MQKAPRPVSLKVCLMMVLKAEPTSLPMAMSTSTLASMWPMVRAMSPPVRGHAARVVETVS